jgi:murein DD-endopeptidase MepM/ murein hydrolase activator NlpD
MSKQSSERRCQWVVVVSGVIALAGCTTYQPLDGGSRVPWASAQRQPSQVAAVSRPAIRREAAPQLRVEPRRPAVAETSVSPPAPVVAAAAPVVKKPVRQRAKPAAAVVAAPAEVSPSGAQHRVASGDRLGAVADAYGVSLEALARANHLSPPYVIYVGQVLQIPAGAKVTPVRYAVRRGDTLSGIARRFDVAMADVAAANGIRSPYRLSVGQSLEIPGVQTAKAVPDAAPPALTGRGFLWPVSGKVIGGFGIASNGQHRNGINIAARKGAPVVASEDGIVVYASDGIDGYGRMVLVRHAEGYITTYAHNASLLVDVGDVVHRGQVIARVGDTGDVSQSQLHFELRRGTKPINPEAVLVRDSTAVASTT